MLKDDVIFIELHIIGTLMNFNIIIGMLMNLIIRTIMNFNIIIGMLMNFFFCNFAGWKMQDVMHDFLFR